MTQRLCDQTLVSTELSMLSSPPTCKACFRIKKLMVEFATVYPPEEDDGLEANGANGVGTYELQEGQSNAAE